MSKFGISQPVRRVEDLRFLTGAGRYVGDLDLPGQAHAVVFRSPLAHARIHALEVADARAAPGVIDVITGAELDAAGVNNMACPIPLSNRDGTPRAEPGRPLLATGTARYAGDNLALVVAETLAQAREAAELIVLDAQELDPVVDTAAATADGMPLVHEGVARNLCFDWAQGDEAAVAEAFRRAAHVTRLSLVNNRVVANSMEPRGAIAQFSDGRLTLHTNTQGGWDLKRLAARAAGLRATQVRVLTPDVGGGFGMKGVAYPEQLVVAYAARKLGRPVKWIAERGESFLSDTQGRDHVTRAELALDAGRRVTGLRVHTVANMGAYLSDFAPFIPTLAAVKVLPGVYDVKCMHYRVEGVFTHTTPVDAYRGAGRPESIYVIERLMDQAARDLGEDPHELRRRNFVPPRAMPYTSAAGEVYDSGEFERVMDLALAGIDRRGFEQRRAQAATRGRLRGQGLCYYIESTMGEPAESAALRFTAAGRVQVLVGTQSNGQGHETAYAQILHERLGVPFEAVEVIQGDTDAIAAGGGTGGSRSVTAQGWAIGDAAKVVIERGMRYAARELEAAVQDIGFDAGQFHIVGTDRRIGIMELAARAQAEPIARDGLEAGLDGEATITVGAWNFPNGCHVAEVEVDPDTGRTRIERYLVVDDFGRIINPLLLAGQIHGGVVQGVGQALLEHTVYDPSGQLLSGSFMDYCMPRADDVPAFEFSTVEVPCPTNPLGMKGCGEAGSVGACAAVMNALMDALAAHGVSRLDMPATPLAVWRALHRRGAIA